MLLLSGCAGRTVTRTVPVTRVEHEYLPVPAALTMPCSAADVAAIRTNGDLLAALLADQAALAACNAQLRAIKALLWQADNDNGRRTGN
jgi:hypothetical protein